MNTLIKYRCPCCGNLTFDNMPSGTFYICPVCYWEDDNIQNNNPTYEGGANEISLIKAKKNYLKFGAIQKKYITYVREPFPDEIPPD